METWNYANDTRNDIHHRLGDMLASLANADRAIARNDKVAADTHNRNALTHFYKAKTIMIRLEDELNSKV